MDVVIFGDGPLARLAGYTLTHDSEHRVVAFTTQAAYLRQERFMDLPVLPFETLAAHFPPDKTGMLIPLGWRNMNGLRAAMASAARDMGYRLIRYVSSHATVWPDLDIGENTMVYDGCLINPFVRTGANCLIRSGALLAHDVVLADNCFVSARASLGGAVQVGEGCVLGLGSIVRDDVRIAPRCFIGAGAVVVADTEPDGVYVGVPARRKGNVADLKDMWTPPRG